MVPAVRPAALAETVSVLLVVAAVVDRLTVNQLAEVETVKGVAMVLVKATVFESGKAPLRIWVNDREEGSAVMVAVAPVVTKSSTFMVILCPDPAMVSVP